MKRFRYVRWILIGFALAALPLILWRLFEPAPRGGVPRSKLDMRSLATALESYCVDTKSFSAMIPLDSFGPIAPDKIHDWRPTAIFPGGWLRQDDPAKSPAFLRGLTTPVGYISKIPTDPHAEHLVPYAYYNDGEGGWILISVGPDRDYDIDPPREYDSSAKTPSEALVRKTYDPSNGATVLGWTRESWISDGDIFRVKD